MPIELATFVAGLSVSDPPGSDQRKQGDDHIRLIKTCLRNSFPNSSKTFYIPDAAAKTGAYVILVTEQNKIFECSTAAAAYSVTLPVLVAGDAGWQCVIWKSTSDTNILTVVAGAGLINGATSIPLFGIYDVCVCRWTGAAWIAETTSLTGMVITSTDAGAVFGPSYEGFRDSPSPAVSDALANFIATGRSSTGVKRTYTRFGGFIWDPTNGSETGGFEFGYLINGTYKNFFQSYGYGETFIIHSNSGYPIWQWCNTTNDANAAGIKLRKDRNGGSIQLNDSLGTHDWAGHDGVAYQLSARIEALIDAAPGAGDMPTRFVFSTNNDGSATLTERLRLKSDGLITTGVNDRLIPGVLFKALVANEAGADVATAQPWFPTNSGVAVEAATTYMFEGLLWLSRAAGAVSHTTGLLFGGTATLTDIMYAAFPGEGDVVTINDVDIATFNVATLSNIKAASTATTEQIKVYVKGIVRITAAGTFIPQFQFSAAPGGAPTVQKSSFFRLEKWGSNVVASQGTWA